MKKTERVSGSEEEEVGHF